MDLVYLLPDPVPQIEGEYSTLVDTGIPISENCIFMSYPLNSQVATCCCLNMAAASGVSLVIMPKAPLSFSIVDKQDSRFSAGVEFVEIESEKDLIDLLFNLISSQTRYSCICIPELHTILKDAKMSRPIHNLVNLIKWLSSQVSQSIVFAALDTWLSRFFPSWDRYTENKIINWSTYLHDTSECNPILGYRNIYSSFFNESHEVKVVLGEQPGRKISLLNFTIEDRSHRDDIIANYDYQPQNDILFRSHLSQMLNES